MKNTENYVKLYSNTFIFPKLMLVLSLTCDKQT